MLPLIPERQGVRNRKNRAGEALESNLCLKIQQGMMIRRGKKWVEWEYFHLTLHYGFIY
jgi:hypothetical protein